MGRVWGETGMGLSGSSRGNLEVPIEHPDYVSPKFLQDSNPMGPNLCT